MGVVMRVEVVARDEDPDSASEELIDVDVDDKDDSEDAWERLRSCAGRLLEGGKSEETKALGSRTMLVDVREVRGEE